VKSKFVLPVALGAAMVLAAAAAGGKQATSMSPTEFTAVLNAGQEVPHPTHIMSGASGKFTATLNGTTLKWKLTFAHLTGPASAAHIHAGKKGVPGAVIVPLCGPCTSPASGTATVSSSVISKLKAGTTYVNVHTAKNQNGEIRGQIRMGM
jgi:hypothetical protein